jgi:sulfofructose kinase
MPDDPFVSRVGRARPVIAVGMAALDYIWTLDRPVITMDAKLPATSFLARGGGMAATAAVAIARLGGQVVFWGRAGDDAEGHLMRDELVAAGVDASGFVLVAGGRSPVSGIVVGATGERLVTSFRGAGLEGAADLLPLGRIAEAGAVLADPRWIEAAEAAFAAARSAGVATVLDAEVSERGLFERLLPLTDHAIFSTPALAGFAGDTGPDALAAVAACGPRVAAVTRGSAGVDWRDADGLHHLDAYPVDVVDTTGAGDVFHGAYALAIAAGSAVGEAMDVAAATAALKCTKPDGRSGIPALEDALEFRRNRA